jgi:hypothetical protein
MSEGYARLEPTLIPMLRPLCPVCQGRLMLTCIEPDCDGAIYGSSNAPSAATSTRHRAEDTIKLAR